MWAQSGSRAIALLFDLKKLAARSLDADEAAALLELTDGRLQRVHESRNWSGNDLSHWSKRNFDTFKRITAGKEQNDD